MKKRVANLDTDSLYEMGDALKVQNRQLHSVEAERDEVKKGIEQFNRLNAETRSLLEEAEREMDEMDRSMDELDELLSINDLDDATLDDLGLAELEALLAEDEEPDSTAEEASLPSGLSEEQPKIKRAETIVTHNDWGRYQESLAGYVEQHGIDLSKDPFSTELSQRQYEELNREVNDEFAKKTSIVNKVDLSFLAIATALQVTKALLYPQVTGKLGYGQSFDPAERLAHNDKSIVQEERRSRDAYKNKQLENGNEAGEWLEMLYRTPPYDTTVGSPAIGINMEGGYHRLHTLGHDPVLGWIFGTANILTDTVTFETLQTNKVTRTPHLMITPEQVPPVALLGQTVEKVKENRMNLPTALFAEAIHLKSDAFTKYGLPVPVLEVFSPQYAGKLYKNQYDALCFSRDLKIIGASATVSLLINMVIGLAHGLFYNQAQDGTRELFEVRTRKLLLISNTIATTSNLVYASITQNPKALDIGGLLVTVTRLFTDARFILRIKQEFVENRIYEKIEDEIREINETKAKLTEFEYQYFVGKREH